MGMILNKRYALCLLLQVLIAVAFSADLKAQSPLQLFDERVFIDQRQGILYNFDQIAP
jgi:hypothetical protein